MSIKDGFQTVRLVVKKESNAPRVRPGQVIPGFFTTLPVPGEGTVEGIQLFADFEVYLPMRSHEAVLAARVRRNATTQEERAQDERALAERNRRNAAVNDPSSPSDAASVPSEDYGSADTSAQATTEASIDALHQEGIAIISNVMLEAQTLIAGGNGLDPGNLSNGIFDFSSKLAPALRCAQEIDSLAIRSANPESARSKARDLLAKIEQAKRQLAQAGIH